MWTLHADLKLGKKVLDTTLRNYQDKLNCNKIIIAQDHKDNFRMKLYSHYKSHRKKIRKPIIVKPLKEYMYTITTVLFLHVKVMMLVEYLQHNHLIKMQL